MNARWIVLLGLVLILAGCADAMTFEQAARAEQSGFFAGAWHGFILPFAWIGSIFSDSIAIYAIANNGILYDSGFMLGVSLAASIGFLS